MSQDNIERELKLMPVDDGLLDRLARISALGPLRVAGTRRERQRNSFFDTPGGGLRRARVGFRRRLVDGERQARWSLKGDGERATRRGVSTRSEIEVQLDADLPPALALGALRQAARARGAAALAEQVDDGLASGELPRREPYLETETDRRIVDLVAPSRGWEVELALDRVRLVGHRYAETEIEAELKKGGEEALDTARREIEALGDVRVSPGSKLSRAQAHMETCRCGSGGEGRVEPRGDGL